MDSTRTDSDDDFSSVLENQRLRRIDIPLRIEEDIAETVDTRIQADPCRSSKKKRRGLSVDDSVLRLLKQKRLDRFRDAAAQNGKQK